MPYCIYCGVLLSNRLENCPLCSSALETVDNKSKDSPVYPKEIVKITFIKSYTTEKDLMKIHFAGFFSFLILLLTSGIDYSINSNLTWSKFSTLSLLFVYSILTAGLKLKKNPFSFYTLLNIEIGVFLLILDILTPENKWFIQFGLPSLVSLQILALLIFFAYKKVKLKLLRASSTIILSNMYILLLDKIILGSFTWSLICTAILLPTCIFLYLLSSKLQNSYY